MQQTTLAALVLIAEDDPDSLDMLATTLTMEGFEVVTARNGFEALHAARSRRPALILLDLMMPGMDGFTFRYEQQHDSRILGIPVICVSGRSDAMEVAITLGTEGCVMKPIKFDNLLRAMARCLPTQ